MAIKRHGDKNEIDRILTRGSLGLGETYVDGCWDCDQVDEFIPRILRVRLDEQGGSGRLVVGIAQGQQPKRWNRRKRPSWS